MSAGERRLGLERASDKNCPDLHGKHKSRQKKIFGELLFFTALAPEEEGNGSRT